MSQEIQDKLDRAASNGTEWLGRQNQRRGWKLALADALSDLWIAPLACLGIYALGTVFLRPFGVGAHSGFAWWFLLVLVLLWGAVRFFFALKSEWAKNYERSEGLALLDERLELEDRLQTADAFLSKPTEGLQGAFQSAAITDAQSHLDRALGESLADDPQPWTHTRRVRNWLVVALVLSLIAWILPGWGGASSSDPESTIESASTGRRITTQEQAEDPAVTDPPPAKENVIREPESKEPAKASTKAAEGGESSPIPDEAKETDGKSSKGESGEASSAAGSSEARGVPSDQGQTSKASKKKKPAKKKKAKKKTDAKDQEPSKPKEQQEKSGSTAGLGSASGSNKNPASTSWSSKDQVTDTEDDEIEDDEEVDDEDSESEARGGIQPSLRDRKPAVSRDLQIGFGNRPSPDANGRGGPSQAKKSRGTASLILGVPIPDHIKGQPNPGKTKITQERIEPKADPLDQAEARPRDERRLPAGRVPETAMEPWMRDLVRSFFLEVRAKDRAKPNN